MDQKCFNSLSDLLVGETLGVERQCDQKRGVGLPIYEMESDSIVVEDDRIFIPSGCERRGDPRIHVGEIAVARKALACITGKLTKNRGHFFSRAHLVCPTLAVIHRGGRAGKCD